MEIEPVQRAETTSAGRRKFEDTEPAAGAKHPEGFGETGLDAAEIANSESDGHRIERPVGKGQLLGIALHQFDTVAKSPAGHLAAPHGEHLAGKVDTGYPGRWKTAGQGDGYIARPCGYIEYGSRRTGRHDADHTPPPQSVHPERKQVVQQVISGGDAVEHLAHPRFFAVLFHHITDNAWSAPV